VCVCVCLSFEAGAFNSYTLDQAVA
jgi:hypothetical protein